jgi:NADPH:quinone reductase-like Zn-dependent oxidoreductase
VREAYPDGVDVVLDTIGGETQARSRELLKEEGRLVSIAQPPQDGLYVFVRPDSEQLAELAELADEGRLAVHLSEVVPLEEAARAHELSETGHVRGKLVLRVA